MSDSKLSTEQQISSIWELPDVIRSYVSILAKISAQLRDQNLRTAPMDALNILVNVLRVTENDVGAAALEQLEKGTGQPRKITSAQVVSGPGRRMKRSIGKTGHGDLALLLEIGYAAYSVQKTMGVEVV
jgi:hypothetical protein